MTRPHGERWTGTGQSRKDNVMVATIDSAATTRFNVGVSGLTDGFPGTTREAATLARPQFASSSLSATQPVSLQPDTLLPSPGQSVTARPFSSADPGYITVEPDGRDDVGFRDRLRQAIEAVVKAFADREGVTAIVERVVGEITPSLDQAAAEGAEVGVQIRIASLDVAVSDGQGGPAFASIRQFALEIGVARDGVVSTEDTRVLSPDGRDLGLDAEQVGAGLAAGGRFARTETGAAEQSDAARERLEEARAGLARVKAMQDALQAFRLGDETPLRTLFEGDGAAEDGGALGQVFPGVGALSFR